jgi:hypothetical protein
MLMKPNHVAEVENKNKPFTESRFLWLRLSRIRN